MREDGKLKKKRRVIVFVIVLWWFGVVCRMVCWRVDVMCGVCGVVCVGHVCCMVMVCVGCVCVCVGSS